MVPVRNLISAAFAALVFGGPLSAQQTAPVTSVTLAEALRRAQGASPSVVSAFGSIRSAELSIRSATWALLPNLTVNPQMSLNLSNGNGSRLDPITGELISGNVASPTYTFGASASYLIFDGFARNYTLKQQRANSENANTALVVSKLSSDLATTQAFFAALASRQQLAVATKNLEAADGQLKLAAAKLHAGSATRSDSLSALGSYLQSKLQLLQAQNSLVSNEATLGRLVGVAGRVTAADDSAFYRSPTSIDTAAVRQEALTASPSIKSGEASVFVAEQTWRASKAAYYPTLSATAAQSWVGYWASQSPPLTSTSSGLAVHRSLNLTLSFSPWTSYARETTIENNAIRISNAQATLADTRNAIAAQVNLAYATLSTALETIDVSAAAVVAGDENLRVVTERYRIGVATITEVLSAQQLLTNAQVSQLTARYSYLNAKASLESILGRKL